MSMSMDQGHSPAKPAAASRGAGAKDYPSSPDAVKTTSIANRPFDEAFEVSQSGSEESFDSQESEKKISKPKPAGPMQGAAQVGIDALPFVCVNANIHNFFTILQGKLPPQTGLAGERPTAIAHMEKV